LEGCFLTLRITPKNEVNSLYVLVEESPELMFERMKNVLEHKTVVKFQIKSRGKFRKIRPASGGEEFEEIIVPSRNYTIQRECRSTVNGVMTMTLLTSNFQLKWMI
jgi:hypothetical protein